MLYCAIDLGTCWHVMGLSPCGLVRVPIRRCVSDVVGPGVKGIRVSPFLCLLCAIDPISHRHGAGTRDTGAVVVVCIIVSTVKTLVPRGYPSVPGVETSVDAVPKILSRALL